MDETRTQRDCPPCYGNAAAWNNTPACKTCEYLGSCKWYAENPDPYPPGERGKKEHFVSYEALAFSSEIADIPAPPEDNDLPENDPDEEPRFSAGDLRRLLEFFLRDIDDYSLAIVECALRTGSNSSADLARAFNVSREAIHRKLVDTCRDHPEIGTMLRGVLCRCARLANPETRETIAGRRVRLQPDENQMEFDFNA